MRNLLQLMSDGRAWRFAQMKRIAFSDESEDDAERAFMILKARGLIKDYHRNLNASVITSDGIAAGRDLNEAYQNGSNSSVADDGDDNAPVTNTGATNTSNMTNTSGQTNTAAPTANAPPAPPAPPAAPQPPTAPMAPMAPAAPAKPTPNMMAQATPAKPQAPPASAADMATAKQIAGQIKAATPNVDPKTIDASVNKGMAAMGKSTQNSPNVTPLVKQQLGVQESTQSPRRGKGK